MLWNMRIRFIVLAFVGGVIFGATSARAAAGPEVLGKYGTWTSYRMTESDQPVCYMSITAKPPVEKDKKVRRGEVVLMITHRPADNSTDVVSYTAGVKFKSSSEAEVTIGSKKFSLFTQGDTAWSRDAATDHALATAIRNGSSMTISGYSARDTTLNDTLNLKGSFQAYVAINKACGLPVPEEPKPAKKPAPKKSGKSSKKKNP